MAAIAHRLRVEALESRRLMAANIVDPLFVAVESSGMEGLRAAEIQLRYDPQTLNIQASDIRPGAAWKDQASLFTNVDETEGSVRIFLFSVQPIDTQRGKLVDLHFEVNEGGAVDGDSVALSHLRLNEGELESHGTLTDLSANSVDTSIDASIDTNIDASIDTNIDASIDTNIDASIDTSINTSIDTSTRSCSPWSTFVQPVETSTSLEKSTDSPAEVDEPLEPLTAPDTRLGHQAPSGLWQLAAPPIKPKQLGHLEVT